MTKAIKITKMQKTAGPTEYQKEEGCVAFQMIKFEYSFYGSKQTDLLDTKILPNGKQIVINGNGFIKAGHEI